MASSTERAIEILLVDDHQDTLAALSRILAQRHSVKTADSYAAAMEVASRGPLDLVITDIGLPDRTGYDLMSDLKGKYGLPGIALTGMDEDTSRCREAGFMRHMLKPIQIGELLKAIDEAIAAMDAMRHVAAGAPRPNTL